MSKATNLIEIKTADEIERVISTWVDVNDEDVRDTFANDTPRVDAERYWDDVLETEAISYTTEFEVPARFVAMARTVYGTTLFTMPMRVMCDAQLYFDGDTFEIEDYEVVEVDWSSIDTGEVYAPSATLTDDIDEVCQIQMKLLDAREEHPDIVRSTDKTLEDIEDSEFLMDT